MKSQPHFFLRIKGDSPIYNLEVYVSLQPSIVLLQKLVLMIKPRGEERAMTLSNNVGVFDPALDDARTPMMNGKTKEDKV